MLLELLIVTVGVLLAFQIEQWAQTRREARAERLFLGRLWDETQADLVEATARRDEHRRFAQEVLEASRRIASGGDLAALPGASTAAGRCAFRRRATSRAPTPSSSPVISSSWSATRP